MARILCVTGGLSGMLHATLELARRLGDAGHRVVYASPADVASTVTDHGIEFIALEADAYGAFIARDRRRGLLTRLARRARRRGEGIESLGVGSFPDRIAELAPDLMLIDIEMHAHVLASASLPVTTALLNSFNSIWRAPGVPPPHRLARPGVGWKGSRAGMSLLWSLERLDKLRRNVSRRITRVGCDRLSLLRRLARDRGFDLRRNVDFGHWLRPFTFTHLPVLSLHARELEFAHEPPSRVHYLGPMVPSARPDERVTPDTRCALEELFAWRAAAEGHRLIYAGFGSAFSADVDRVRRLARAVASRSDWRLVISHAGGSADALATLDSLPGNVRAFAWVPQAELLAHADVAVHHGGINTVDECVVNGVPMLVYCGFRTDMAGTAARVAYHGLGICGARDDRVDDMLRHLGRLLDEPTFAAAMERMRAAYARYARERVAERVVAGLLP